MPVKFVFSNLQIGVWMLMHQTSNSIMKCDEKLFDTKELTTQQHAVLMAIKYANGPATPTQIADFVDRNVNSITLIVDRMEKGGLVQRVRDIQDRRSLRIAITEKGEEQLKKSTARGLQMIQNIMKGLSEEELTTLAALLDKVRNQAIQQCYNDKEIKEVVINNQQHMARFLADALGDKQ